MSDNTNLPNKWALLIGINEYPKAGRGAQLRSCVNDVELMADVLRTKFEFPEANIKSLLDTEASHDGILAGMDWLLGQVKADDEAVMYFGGHSYQLADPTGKWPLGRVTALVPSDWDPEVVPGSLLTYDGIYEWLKGLVQVTPNATLIFDTPHAGTISPVAEQHVKKQKQYVFMGACKADQQAYDLAFEGVFHGAFTYKLGQALIGAGPTTTYRQVFEQTSRALSTLALRQQPQMEGNAGRVLFGTGSVEPMRFVPVTARERSSLTLGAGAVHGMTAGSHWGVYSASTRQVTPQTPKVGLVEVAVVEAAQSQARILSEAGPGAIAVGARALEDAHSYGEMRLVVGIKDQSGLGAAADYLFKLLKDSALLRSAGADEHAQVTAWILPPREGIQENDPVPQLKALSEPTWAVVDESEQLVMRPFPAKNSDAVWALRDNLEKLARFRNVLELRNPNLNSPLAGKVEFDLKRRSPKGRWQPVKPEPGSGLIAFDEGEQIALHITNHHSAPLYISILDFDLTRSITVVHPIGGGSEQLLPGDSLVIGTGKVGGFTLYFPSDFPYVPDQNGDEPVQGTETLKLFATTYETDFSSLMVQEGYRGIESSIGETSVLWQLLDMALTGYGTRDRRPVNLPPDQDWTTVERSYVLRRRR